MSWLSREEVRQAVEILFKLGLGAILGGAIGWERELHGRPAGVRTHMLMVIGVILFSEVSKGFGGNDPSRIAAQVVTGVGFLGAGTILRTGLEIKGLTTAASIWAAAAIGMAISVGGHFYLVAAIGTCLSLLTLTVVDTIEKRFAPNVHGRELLMQVSGRSELGIVIEELEKMGARIESVKVADAGPLCDVRICLVGDRENLLRTVVIHPHVSYAEWAD